MLDFIINNLAALVAAFAIVTTVGFFWACRTTKPKSKHVPTKVGMSTMEGIGDPHGLNEIGRITMATTSGRIQSRTENQSAKPSSICSLRQGRTCSCKH